MDKNTISQTWLKLSKAGRKLILHEYLSRVVVFLILFCVSGNWGWSGAWILIFFAVLSLLLIHLFVVVPNPELYNERGTKHTDTKSFDTILLPLYTLLGYRILIVGGLDERFHWSDLPSLMIPLGIFFMVGTCILIPIAMRANPFFSSTVRIQSERGQTVVEQGPYSIVRHPGYLGGIFFYIACSCLLDSIWAFLPTAFTITLICIRTRLEDDTLQRELPGYKEYAQKVHSRLFPGLW